MPSQDVSTGAGVASGAMSGVAAGSAAGPAGMVVGGILGAGLGYLGSQKSKGPSFDQSWFDARTAQINQYENALAGARTSYLTSLGNMYNDAYKRFNANIQPSFASRGLQVDSGAFAQALAYKSSEYSAELAPAAFAAQREDLNSVDKARGAEWATEVGAKTGGATLGYNTDVASSVAMGKSAMDSFGKLAGLYGSSNPGAYTPSAGNGLPGDSFGTQATPRLSYPPSNNKLSLGY